MKKNMKKREMRKRNRTTQKHKNTKTQKHKNTKTQKHKNTKTQKQTQKQNNTKITIFFTGTKTSEIHTHIFIEEVFILEGELLDLSLEKKFEKGSYCFRLPEMKHGPYETEKGCLMFVSTVMK
jgi:hypothetical protein